MSRANRDRPAANRTAHSQEAHAGPGGRKRRTVKAAVLDKDTAAPKGAEEALRESEARYRALVEHIPAIVYMAALDEVSATLYISPQIESLLGVSPAEWTTHPELFVERLHPEDRERVLADLALSHGSGEPFVSEYRMLAGDGSVRWFRDEAAVISNAAGEPLFLQGVMLDITERKEAEGALRASESKYRGIFESIQDIFYRTDAQGMITEITPSIGRHGYTPEELIGTPVLGVYEDPQDRSELLKALLKHGEVADHEVRLKAKDGRAIVASASSRLVRGPDGAPIAVEGLLRDITERKQVEEALRARTHDLGERVKELDCLYGLSTLVQTPGVSLGGILQGTAELIPLAWQYPEVTCARITLDGQEFTTANFVQTSWTQTSDIAVHGERTGTLEVCYLEEKPELDEGPFHKEERSLISVLAERLGHVIEQKQAEDSLRRSRAELETRVEERTAELSQANQSLRKEITERKRGEEALRESEERLRTVVSNAPVVVWAMDREGVVTLSEGKGLEALGLKPGQVVGQSVFDLYADKPHILEGDQRALAGEELRRLVEVGGVVLESLHRPVRDENGEVTQVIGVATNVTERYRAEEALRDRSEFLQRTLDSLSHPFYVIDAKDYTIKLANAAAGFDPSSPSATCHALTHGFSEPCGDSGHACPLQEAKKSRVPLTVEHVHRDRHGRPRIYEVHCYPILDSAGNVKELIEYTLDITERRRAEEALRESEELLRTVVSNAPIILCAFDRDGVVTLTEGKGLDALGLKPGEHAGLSVFDLYRESPQVTEAVRLALTGEALTSSAQLAGMAFEAHLAPVRDQDGQVSGMIGVAIDVTERKRTEEALRRSEERLRTVISNAPVILFATDSEGVVTVNEGQGLGTLGIGPGEHVGRSMFDLYRNLPEFAQDLRRALAGEALTTTVARAGMAYEAHLAPVRDDGGRVSGLIGVATDVTERKRVGDALHESEERLRTVVTNAPVVLFAIDREGVLTLREGRGADDLGLQPEELLGRPILDWAQGMPGLEENVERALAGEAFTTTVEWGGSTFEVRFVPVHDENGQPSGGIGVATNVTERLRAEKETRRLSELKSDFIALVSHELRSPLTSLGGGLELIAQDAPSLPPRAQRALELMSQECARLTTLVESTLDMTRLDAGELPLTLGPACLEPVIAQAAASIAGAGSHHPVDVRVPHGLPPAWADEVHLGQVLRNLLSNAVKYSAWDQPIVIEARTEGDCLMISITDRGQGVRREEQQHIFDAFYRAAGADESSAGYGLGLYFARKLIEAQGGAIEVESPAFDDPAAPGTTFTVTLPIAEGEA